VRRFAEPFIAAIVSAHRALENPIRPLAPVPKNSGNE